MVSMLLVLLVASAISFANADSGVFHIINNIDLSSGDISNQTGVLTTNACMNYCIGITGCIGFTYDVNGTQCWAKSGDWQPKIYGWTGVSGFLNTLPQANITVPTMDFTNGDIGGSTNQPDEKTCAAHCAQTAGCIGYSFATDGSNNCWVKRGPWTVGTASQRNSGVLRSKTVNYNQYIAVPGWDFRGGDIGNPTSIPSVDACADLCATTPGCLGFAYGTDVGNCWVKNGNWTLSLSSTRIGGLMTATARNYTSINQLDLYGGDIVGSSMVVANTAACAALCSQTAGCVGYTWYTGSIDHGTCQPKNGNWTVQPNVDRASGTLIAWIPQYNLIVGYDFNGGDIAGSQSVVPSFDACAILCRQTPGCVGFTVVTSGTDILGKCMPKNGGWTVSTTSERTSGLLRVWPSFP